MIYIMKKRKMLLNIVCHFLIGIHLYILLWQHIIYVPGVNRFRWERRYETWYKLHACFSGSAIAFCLPEGLLTFCPENFTGMLPSKVQRWVQLLFFVGGSIILSVGTVIATVTYDIERSHEYTGLTSIILFIIAILYGIVKLCRPNDYRSIKFVQCVIGISGYTFGIVALILSYHLGNSCYLYSNITGKGYIQDLGGICDYKWCLTVILFAILIITLIAPVKGLKKYFKINYKIEKTNNYSYKQLHGV